MYEQYKSDKNAVDKSWWPVFEKFEAEGGASATCPHGRLPGQGIVRLERRRRRAAKTATPAKATPATPSQKPSEPAPAADQDTTTDRGVNPSTSDEETVKAESKSVPAQRTCRSAGAPSQRTSRTSSRSCAAPRS